MYKAKLNFLIYKYYNMNVLQQLPLLKNEIGQERYKYLRDLFETVLNN